MKAGQAFGNKDSLISSRFTVFGKDWFPMTEIPHPYRPVINQEERSLDSRGTEPLPVQSYPTISATPASVDPTQELQAWQEGHENIQAAKEAWKDENPTWPLNEALRNSSGFVFSVEEIKKGLLDLAGWIPPITLYVEIIQIIKALEPLIDGALSGGPNEVAVAANSDSAWEAVDIVLSMILSAVLEKKLKLGKAKELIAEAFQKTGLSQKISRLAAKEVLKIQQVVAREYERLLKQKGFSLQEAWRRGIRLDQEVKEVLVKEHARHRKSRSGFWFAFEQPMALRTGRYHPGPNIDVILGYNKRDIARIDLKLSLDALSPTRSQTLMMVNDAQILKVLVMYITPETIVILPDDVGSGGLIRLQMDKGDILSNID